MSKKRRLSSGLSSRDSATPAPSTIPPQVTISQLLEPGSSPQPELPEQDGLSIPGPSRLSASASATPVPTSVNDRSEAKAGTIVAGSGDGVEHGDECFLWGDLPMNKQGFRYAPCALSPTPSPHPLIPFHRTLPGPSSSPPVHISWLDRSSFLRLSSNGLTATTDRGYRSARANVGVRTGTWYYETLIVRGDGDRGSGSGTGGDSGNAHCRIGWGRREANLDAPVGMDGYGYAIRDVHGEKVHLSRPKSYGSTFKTGDVVGCLISLPARQEDGESIKRKRVPIRYKGQFYFEMDEYGVQKEMEALVDREGKAAAAAKAAAESAKEVHANEDKAGKKKGATTKNAKKGKNTVEPTGPIARQLPILPGSHVEFFLNGEPLGIAFEDIYDYTPLPPLYPQTQQSGKHKHHTHDPLRDILHDDGTLGYYPMISCFGRGKVKCNFGPEWLKPPNTTLVPKPIAERWEEWREEERRLDERDEERDTKRLIKEMEADEARRKVAEAKMAAVKDKANGVNGSSIKRKPGPKKKRKGTDTPATTPGLEQTPQPDSTPAPEDIPNNITAIGTGNEVDRDEKEAVSNDVKMETQSAFSPGRLSRAGTEDIVKRENEEADAAGMDVDGERDEEEGVKWD